MFLHEFPDIGWLKNQIDTRFGNRLGWGNCRLESEGFPSVVIHTKTRECYRPDVKGPFSLFLNLRGRSSCRVDGQVSHIHTDHYFVSNSAQLYTLQVEKGGETETFNIHFGEFFAGSVLNALVTPADRVLENGTDRQLSPVVFFNQLHRRDEIFNRLVDRLMRTEGQNKLAFEEGLSSLLEYHLQQHRHITARVNRLPSLKKAVRVELYKRLSRAMDAIHAGVDTALSLDRLAVEACLSKYHFLRLFRQTYGLSPHQYIQQLRLEKAKSLLSDTQIPVADMAGMLGYKDGPSFSRLFAQRMGVYPSEYRAQIK